MFKYTVQCEIFALSGVSAVKKYVGSLINDMFKCSVPCEKMCLSILLSRP